MANKKEDSAPSKKAVAKRSSTPKRKTTKSANSNKKSSWKKKIFMGMLLVSVLCACFLAVYLMILDSQIRDRMAGEKWKLPAWIYSRPLELYKNQRISMEQMENELSMLNYRKVTNPSGPGEYAKNGDKMVIIKRPFSYFDGDEPERHLYLVFDQGRILSLQDAKTLKPLAYARMDPIILDRITVGNEEDRILVRLSEVNPMLIKMLIAIEDRNFYEHNGINPFAIIRAAIANFRAGKNVQGGSTLTQQFAKNFFLTQEKTIWRKAKEALMALLIDARYEKDQILEAYINEIYLGQNGGSGVYGFGLASYFYFGLPIGELDIDQMALLITEVRGPSYYDPWRHPDRAKARRDMILQKLMEEGLLTPEQFDKYASRDIQVLPRGKMSYGSTPAYVDLVKRELKGNLGDDIFGESGLRIFTSFDPIAQRAAERAVAKIAQENTKQYPDIEVSMSVANWHKGEIVALVGGKDFKTKGLFNRALDARRPIGSTVKPMVYLTAFAEKDYQLGSVLSDTAMTVKFGGKDWRPSNFDHKFRGKVFLADALAKSLNIPVVRVGIDVGVNKVLENLKRVGLDSDVQPYPSLLLGTPEMSSFELCQMYQVFASGGYYKPLSVIRAVLSDDGSSLYETSGKATKTFDEADVYVLTRGLMRVVSHGTARSLSEVLGGKSVAGKTGTSDGGRDTWFAGFDNDEVAAVWLGRDGNGKTKLTGSSGALKVYKEYLRNRGVNSLSPRMPDGIIEQRFSSGGYPIENRCREPGSEMFPAKAATLGTVSGCFYSE